MKAKRPVGSKTERSDGVWLLRASRGYDPATKKWIQISKTFHGSERAATKALGELVQRANAPEVVPTKEVFAFAVDRFVRQAELKDREQNTIRSYKQLAKVVKRELGHITLANLDVDQIEAFYSWLAKKKLSPSTIRHYHAVINGSLKLATGRRWITHNAATATARPAVKRPKLTIPTPDQVRRILEQADAYTNKELGMLVRLAVASWARRGELAGLQWPAVNFQQGTIYIRASLAATSVRDRPQMKDPKSHANRTLAIDHETMEALSDYLLWQQNRANSAGSKLVDDAFVFATEVDGSRPIHPDSATGAFKTIATRAKVSGVRLHDIRHFGPTQALGAGMPIPMVSYRLGHAKITTTLDMYVDHIPERDRDVATFMGELMRPQPAIETAKPPAEAGGSA